MAKAKTIFCLVMLSVCVLFEVMAADPPRIDYGAIGRNHIPCSKKDLSQNNCNGRSLQPTNPYRRGCSKIAGCRGPSSVDGSEGQNQGDNEETAIPSASGDNGQNQGDNDEPAIPSASGDNGENQRDNKEAAMASASGDNTDTNNNSNKNSGN